MFILGISLLVFPQSQAMPIPSIDWSNLPYQQQVKQVADGWRSKYNLPGVWCAFIKDGKVVACVATGYRELESRKLASVSDYVNLGSVSKPFAGTLIAQFVSQRVISYSTKIRDVFPELAQKHSSSPLLDATLLELINHTSGLRYGGGPLGDLSGPEYRLQQMVNALQDRAAAPPGTKYEYRYGMNIAVAMVERITGTAFESWLSGNRAASLGLSDPVRTVLARYQDEITPYYVDQQGNVTKGKVELPTKGFDAVGSISLRLTDLCGFALSVLTNGSKLSESVLKATLTPQSSLSSQSAAGWLCGKLWIDHEGNTGRGEYCLVSLNPRKRNAFILYTNGYFKQRPKSGELNFMTEIIRNEIPKLIL